MSRRRFDHILRPADTSAEAARVQREILDRMSPEELVQESLDASELLREIALEGIVLRHPEYSERERQLALFRLWLGDALFSEAYPGVDVEP